METTVNEINDGIYRLSTYVPEADFMFNQFVIDAEEPLLFHCGPRQLFPLVSRPRRASFRSSGCGGSRSATSSPTSAGR